jgi:transcriptional regulator with XRE-family HTH domain
MEQEERRVAQPPKRSSFGIRLKTWRKRRRVSQLELSCRAGVGQRHLSFIETGRSRPGKEVVLRLASALELPLREQNVLLADAGFGAIWPETALDTSSVVPLRQVLMEMLERQEPYPAYVLDRQWTVVSANRAACRIFGPLMPRGSPVNMLEVLLDGEAMRQAMVNRDEILRIIEQEIAKDLSFFPDNPILSRLYTRIEEELGPAPLREVPSSPVHLVHMRIGETVLTTLSTVARFHGALDVFADELRVELVYPADELTRQFFHRAAEAERSSTNE